MTSGSRLEIVGSLRSVEGFHDVRACSRIFQALYLLPAPPPHGGEANDARVGSQRDCFVTSLLRGDAFSCRVMRWMVYPTPTPAYGS
jgi:hypothetical protein